MNDDLQHGLAIAVIIFACCAGVALMFYGLSFLN